MRAARQGKINLFQFGSVLEPLILKYNSDDSREIPEQILRFLVSYMLPSAALEAQPTIFSSER